MMNKNKKNYWNPTALLTAIVLCVLSASASAQDQVVLYHPDHLGSAIAAFNENGDKCWDDEEQYSPYGEKETGADSFPLNGCGIVGEERGYTGHTVDYSTDLVYMQQRYYDPTLGRFLSVDPISTNPNDPRTINRYSYAANNPYKYTDPTGELFFLAPVAVFVAKEVAAEVASRATNGATDFLSLRRLATKGVKAVAKKFAKKESCTFDGNTEVLTFAGYQAIKDIDETEKVWSRDESTGKFGWEAVLHAYSNTYAETVYITLKDVKSDLRQTIVSNRIHPFFVQRDGAVHLHKVSSRDASLSTEGHIYTGSIPNGHWIDAALLESGDRLLNNDGSWSAVLSVEIEKADLLAYNLKVANSDTFFVRGADAGSDKSVWVHNCPDVPKGGGRSKNKLEPDPDAVGDHTVVQRGVDGEIYKYETYEKTSSGHWNPVKRYDGGKPDGSPGAPHFNKKTGESIPTPHVQGKSIPGGARSAEPWEIPK